MSKHYSANLLRMLRNQIPIDEVITDLLNLKVRNVNAILRFRCPLCDNFHTATNHETNLARCFDCQKNFNPIDLVMTVGKCSFVDAVQLLKNSIDR
ncbi:MAG: CHC2 zinc finger domain-containing protein [Desulfobacterales bacterium]